MLRAILVAAGSAVACILPAACGLEAQAPITLDDIRGLPGTPWLALSPDGSRVAYLLSTPDAADLWLVDSGGGEPTRVTHEANPQAVAGWRPGGDDLAYVAADVEEMALWIVRPGSDPVAACPLPGRARSAAWIGDGVRLTFAAPPASGSPGEAVFLCDSRTGDVRQVTAQGYHGLEFGWDPEGARVAVSSQERPGFYEGLEKDILLIDAATGETTPLVSRPGIDQSPKWSPDGSLIAFISGFGRSGLLPNLGVSVIRPGDSSPRDIGIGHDRGGFFEGPFLHAWTSDSRTILYSVVDGLETPLFRMAEADGAFARVEVQLEEGQVAYQFSTSRDGATLAFKISSTDQAPDIFTVRPGVSGATRVTRIRDGFTPGGVGRAERIHWMGPDSTRVEGILLRPAESAGPGPYPLVTILHGGPASAYNLSFPSLGFFNPYRDVLLAARGYAVFLPNPRGSGGYGERFRSAVLRDWGDGPAGDVQAGIDLLIEEGIADPAKLALMGWSYGGYLAAWMLAHSDRFAVASVGAGVYDLTTHYGAGGPQMEEYFGGPPWRLPSLYRDQSPIQHVEGISTPTLILHGEADNSVSVAQSELLLAALQREGVPTELLRFSGEGHSLRRTETQNDSWARVLEWLERWLSAERRARRNAATRLGDSAVENVTTLDGIIRAYYDVISGPAGSRPDRAQDAFLHHADALVAITGVRRDGTRSIRTMSLDEYHEAFGGERTTGFYEREIHRRVERFGSIAHVWSTYVSSREPDGTPFARGINSIQLFHDGVRWWITSWVFDTERSDNPLPLEYLPPHDAQ